MAISAVSGVFSRYFVVGFYLPSLLSLLSLWLLASSTWEPDVFLDQSEATQVLIIGAISIWIGLALSGLNYQLYRLYEGYPFEGRETWPLVEVVAGPAYAAQRRR